MDCAWEAYRRSRSLPVPLRDAGCSERSASGLRTTKISGRRILRNPREFVGMFCNISAKCSQRASGRQTAKGHSNARTWPLLRGTQYPDLQCMGVGTLPQVCSTGFHRPQGCGATRRARLVWSFSCCPAEGLRPATLSTCGRDLRAPRMATLPPLSTET